MYAQQKMTPSTMDEMQTKMMLYMIAGHDDFFYALFSPLVCALYID